MKIGRRRAPFLLFLLSSILACEASPGALPRDISRGKNLKSAGSLGEVVAAVAAGGAGKPLGTEHAPVDGRDGMPHDGPFVETYAERERKKTQAADDDLVPVHGSPRLSSNYRELTDDHLPQTNDAVMDDRVRSNPTEGTRGIEGGISGKSRDGGRMSKKPDSPKDARPLPHSEVDQVQDSDHFDATQADNGDPKRILSAPTDLPDKPHDIPHPKNPSSPKDSLLSSEAPERSPSEPKEHEPAVIQPLHSLLLSFTMILFSEIGDKTFLVAALMAMRHPRLVVFSAAYSALITMTVLSAVLGHAVPTLIPEILTKFAAAGLFLVFGVKMVMEARAMSPDEGVGEEMKEVEMELEEKEHQQRKMMRRRSSVSPYALEAGRAGGGRKHTNSRLPSPPDSPASSRETSPTRHSSFRSTLDGISNLCSLLLSPAWVQTFIMTFLGEWGDRSQIATIAMAAGQDYWWVTGGALGGHAICTAAAVIGGKAIAGRVSLKTVTMGGAIAFLVFAVIYLLDALY